jgi:hypothetical protein
MPLEFHDVLTGKGVGSVKIDQHATVDYAALPILERTEMGLPWFYFYMADRLRNIKTSLAGNPDYTDTAFACGSRYSCDGILPVRHGSLFLYAETGLFQVPHYQPLLEYGKGIIRDPVENQAGGKKTEENGKDNRKN